MSGIIGGAGSKSGVIGTTELDYEEGAWTVYFADASSGGNVSSTSISGNYIKIGGLVRLNFQRDSIDTTGCSGTIYIRTLPFTASGFAGGDYYTYRVGGGTKHHSSMIVQTGTEYMRIHEGTGTSSDTDNWLQFADLVDGTSSLYASIVYKTTY